MGATDFHADETDRVDHLMIGEAARRLRRRQCAVAGHRMPLASGIIRELLLEPPCSFGQDADRAQLI